MKKFFAAAVLLLFAISAGAQGVRQNNTPAPKDKKADNRAIRANTRKKEKDYSDSFIAGVGYSFAAFEFDEAKMKSALTYDLSYHKFFNKYFGAGASVGYYNANSREFKWGGVRNVHYTARSIHLGPKFLLRHPMNYNQMDLEAYGGIGFFYFNNKLSVTKDDFSESGGNVGGGLEIGFKIYKNDYLFGFNAARYINRRKFGDGSVNLDRTDFKIIFGTSF